MPACAIYEKAEKLLKNLRDILTLAAFSNLPEKRLQVGIQHNTAQISYKQIQSGSAGKYIFSHRYLVDNGVAITIICATMPHKNLPPIGFCLWLIVILQFLYLYHKLTHLGGFFYDKNRSG